MRARPRARARWLWVGGAVAGIAACGPGAGPAGQADVEGPAPEASVAGATVDAGAPRLPAGFQRGMNLEPIGGFGGRFALERLPAALDALAALGVDHVALIPSFFQRRLGESSFYWKGGREAVDETTRAAIRQARAHGMQVLLKPHLWLEDRSDGAWRGDILPGAAAWPAWERSYREALLPYARMAQQEGVAAISIGSELTALALARPQFWRRMAAEVREGFAGTITYAANWDREFEAIEWWEAVDVLGVDAFWPLLGSADEPLAAGPLRAALTARRDALAVVARREDRPVLLTEIGYRSAEGAAYRPWEWHEGARLRPDPEGQRLIYEAIVDVVAPVAGPGSDDRWLHGAYFWVWYLNPGWSGTANTDFTPRGKPAQDVLAAWFGAR